MGFEFAVDELYATGWVALDTAGCERLSDGRWVPSLDRVTRECAADGLALKLTHVQLFDCVRAEWSDRSGNAMGSVVGQTEHEAAVYALAQIRRAMELV